ncbi:Mth938-like domain-containing protein [Cognatishimia activa]|uniref:Uncharacterized protein n=1 Tax=Cognatishimia activa TaxID=1715691 RepID=A0A0P1ITL0_9RHOB|nr:Mth938-like domain-containing protein [Cognatishimia activa]MEE2945599.1 Mth938-like domain-containing protein [Pseudomonadota bacterium]CUI80139.1 hypothetical protein TA5113_01516 [Cognatishimia activa]CUK26866.1 hypothetical protein TA5114_02684 [Cognatishimia activa]
MRLTEIQFGDAQPIESYGPDFVRVAGEVMAAPTLVHATGAVHWGGTEDTDTIIALAAELDFILLGTGAEMRHAPAEFRKALEEAGIGVEVMKTDSACRTYNVLVSEGRRVAAAILPVEN